MILCFSIVSLSTLLAAGGFLLFWWAPGVLLGAAGLFITGLGVAGLYPLILSLLMASAGSLVSQAGARAALASGAAILLLPLALGRLADETGIQPAYGVVLLLLAAVFAIIQFTARLEARRLPAV